MKTLKLSRFEIVIKCGCPSAKFSSGMYKDNGNQVLLYFFFQILIRHIVRGKYLTVYIIAKDMGLRKFQTLVYLTRISMNPYKFNFKNQGVPP